MCSCGWSCDSGYPSTCRVYAAPRFARVSRPDPFGARAPLGAGLPDYWRLAALGDRIDLASAPVTVKILLENALRHAGAGVVEPAARAQPRRRPGARPVRMRAEPRGAGRGALWAGRWPKGWPGGRWWGASGWNGATESRAARRRFVATSS